jgi:hypothetical protein
VGGRPVQPDVEQAEDHDQHGRAGDGRVGDVERPREVRQVDPVHDPAAQRPRRPEEPVRQVAQGPAQQQAEGDGPAAAAQPPGRADDDEHRPDRDERDDHGVRRAEAERGARVEGEPQRDQPVQQPDRRMPRQPPDDQCLGDLIAGHHDGRDGQHHG